MTPMLRTVEMSRTNNLSSRANTIGNHNQKNYLNQTGGFTLRTKMSVNETNSSLVFSGLNGKRSNGGLVPPLNLPQTADASANERINLLLSSSARDSHRE
jgi:hypothetical protein